MPGQPFQIQSIAIPLVGKDYLSEAPQHAGQLTPMEPFIDSILALGATDVRLVTCSGIYTSNTANAPDAAQTANAQPADADIVAFALRLRAEGLDITWNPFLSVATTDGSVNIGGLQPSNFEQWMAQYKATMVHQAQLAESVGAARFVIISDDVQKALMEIPWDQREPTSPVVAAWLDLIASVRAVFSGDITTVIATDAALFGGGANHVDLVPRPIIEALDSIGLGLIPAPYTSTGATTEEQIVAAWYGNAAGNSAIGVIRDVHADYGKPVWVSNYAAYSFDGSSVTELPVFGTGALTPDEQEQADLLGGMLRVLSLEAADWFQGVSLQNWNRWIDGTFLGARFLDSDVGENFQGKLGEEVVRAWFTGQMQGEGVTREGTAGADTLEGGYHHDTFLASAGNDRLLGGHGIDVAQYDAPAAEFAWAPDSAGWQVTDSNAGRYGADALEGVERLRFSDHQVALDLDGHAGIVARTLGAVFGGEAVENRVYAGIGLQLVDGGMAFDALMQLALQVRLGAGASNADVVALLYANVVGQAPTVEEAAPFVALLDGGMSRGALGVLAAQTALNLQNIGFAELGTQGLAYVQ